MNKPDETSVAELTLALSLILRRIRAETPTEARELSWTQKSVLRRLEKDGPTTTAELARLEGVKPQSMGSSIATLEELGWVERKEHPTDRRQFNIQLSLKGAELQNTSKEARRSWLVHAITKLDKKEQTTLFAAGEIMKRLVDL